MASPRKPVAQPLASPDDAEAQFYEALQNANLDMMMSIWADEDEVACVLPGGPRVVGLAAIRQVCDNLFANGPIQIAPQQVRRLVAGACAVHHVTERVEVNTPQGRQTAYILATNVYTQTPMGWRLVAHHASPGRTQDSTDVSPPAPHLH